MRPSLDPAYIARQIMARNSAPEALPTSAELQLPRDTQPSPVKPENHDDIASLRQPSPTSSMPPAPPPLPRLASSLQPSAHPESSSQDVTSLSERPDASLTAPVSQQPSANRFQQSPQYPSQLGNAASYSAINHPVPGVGDVSLYDLQTADQSQEHTPKRKRGASSSSRRGGSRARGKDTEIVKARGGGRGRERQVTVGLRETDAQQTFGTARRDAIQEQSMPSSQLEPALTLPLQSSLAHHLNGEKSDASPFESLYPPLSTSEAYPALNDNPEASVTPYYSVNHQILAGTNQHDTLFSQTQGTARNHMPAVQTQQSRPQAPASQQIQDFQHPLAPELAYSTNQLQYRQTLADSVEQPVHAMLANLPPEPHGQTQAPERSEHTQSIGYSWSTVDNPHNSIIHQNDEDHILEDEQDNDVDIDDEMGDDMGDDRLLIMQNSMATFEDSVRTFAAGGSEKSLFAQFRDKQPRQRKIIKRGPRKAAEPTGDVKLRLSAATNAFMSGDLDEALHQVNDAIRLNAEIHRSWALLAEILRERGEYKQSLTASVCAAHLQPKIFDAWLDCGRFALELIEAEPDDAEDTLRIAIMTFSQAIKIQPDNVGIRQTRAALYLTRNSYKLAVGEYKWIVERTPFDLLALRGLADASVQLFENHRRYADRQRWEARDAYQRAIEHYQTQYPMGAANDELPFTWDDAFTYTALLLHIDQYGEALYATRSLARWLLGRREEAFWDNIEDDREWDIGEERRRDVPEFTANKYPFETYGAGFALRLRVNLAICRLRLDRNSDEEAMQHLEFLDPTDVSDNLEDEDQQSDLFLEVASALYETKRLTKALPFYEPLRRQADLLDALSLYRAGKCYLEIEDRRQAEECFTASLDFDDTPSDVRINARYELARMYEAARKNEEALYLLEEAMGIEREQKEGYGGSGVEPPRREARPRIIRNIAPKPLLDRPPEEPLAPRERKPPAPRKPRQPGEKRQPRESRPRPLLFALDEDRKLEEERRAAYLAEKWRVIREEREESEEGPGEAWMAAARILVDDFRSFKAFYPWDRYLAQMGLKKDDSTESANPHLLKMAQRLRDEVDAQQSAITSKKLLETTVSYRNVEFSVWLDLFLEFALGLAHSGRIKESYDVCDAALAANVFFENPDDKFLANITKAACAVRGRDEETCVEVSRSFMATYQYCSDAFRLYSALGRLVHSTGTWFAHSKVQKFTLRQIKMMDTKLIPPDKKTKTLEQFDPKTYPEKEQDVQLLMLYGHILFISNSFTFALNYFVRAATLDPDNLMVNISMGQAYLHYGLKRQTENRQQSITQGLLFLHRYYDLKIAGAMTTGQRQEAHYNLARSYHAVGLAHLAAEYYRRVLREVEGEELGYEDLAREAAFNLQQCCLIGGDLEAVRDIAERWLVL